MSAAPRRKGWIKGNAKSGFQVGASEKPAHGDQGYNGPVAQVYYDKTWLYISTDDYEGTAMMNIETLPYLRRALAKIAKQIKGTP